jgi:hypothetical protein
MPVDRHPSRQALSAAGADSFRVSPSPRFGVLVFPKKQKQEQNMGCTIKVHRKNERKVSIEKAHLEPRLRRKKESKDESTESEKQFFSWRITKGDNVMNRKDAIPENEPYILVEVPERGNVGFIGKWLSAAAKADALWNKAIKDHIFKEQVLLLTVLYIPDYGLAALSFVFALQKSLISFMVPLKCKLFEDLHEVEELVVMIEMGFFVRTGQHYKMAIPVNLNIKTVKMAALKFVHTADEVSLHPESLVATIPYAAAKTWQSRQRELCKLHNRAEWLMLLNNYPKSIDIPNQRSN